MHQAMRSGFDSLSLMKPVPYRAGLATTTSQLGNFRVSCLSRMKNCSSHALSFPEDRNKHLQFVCYAKEKKHMKEDLVKLVDGLEQDASSGNEPLYQQEVRETGLRNTRRTKLVCTIGPACCSPVQLEMMADGGMNVARLNMCHGTKEWHAQVIENLRKLNAEKGYDITIMMDTEGSEVHMGDLSGETFKIEDGDRWIFTVRKFEGTLPAQTFHVNYEGFAEDVIIGDELVVDGGMVRFEVIEKIGPDVHCKCIDPGLLLPRANLTFWRAGKVIREGSSMLPTLSSKDWLDIDFGIEKKVDFIAISFVRTAEVVKHLKTYVAARSPQRTIGVIAKIESRESLKDLENIIRVSDGVVVGRSDLGAQIPLEQVPSVQQEVVHLCRQLNKAVIVASQLVESMIEYPTPTRAEVADVSELVREQVDALMLSGESAMGHFPGKALGVLRTVSLRMERWCREESVEKPRQLKQLANTLPSQISEEICNAATFMANKLQAEAIFVYTKGGDMPSLLSRNRPDCPIFAFTDSRDFRKILNMRWGVIPITLRFSEYTEENLENASTLLKKQGLMKAGDLIVAVSDLPPNHSNMLQSIQIRRVP
ncbi:hypothetical protein KP509_19G038300 [Ceratopteris richardii]|uniref:Pyruvate kinase n=1 Tax=Ceratopteris richardii TaxID=49495 RepID=A0A8T2SJU3_CERRI|nr:hypothetical protein KP509_19G038300 [Ceratopteris richardii]